MSLWLMAVRCATATLPRKGYCRMAWHSCNASLTLTVGFIRAPVSADWERPRHAFLRAHSTGVEARTGRLLQQSYHLGASSRRTRLYTLQVIIVGDLNVAATQKDAHHLIKHEKCYTADELALLSALTSRYAL